MDTPKDNNTRSTGRLEVSSPSAVGSSPEPATVPGGVVSNNNHSDSDSTLFKVQSQVETNKANNTYWTYFSKKFAKEHQFEEKDVAVLKNYVKSNKQDLKFGYK